VNQNVAELVKQILPIPDPFASEEQADRHSHRDLPQETEDVLRRQLTALHVINLVVDDDWYIAREMAVANELGYRRSRRRLERPRREGAA
jgi:hypothetical protein